MLNLKSNFVLASLISATTLLTGIGFSSGALAHSDSKHDSHSSSSWGNSCPCHYHYDKHDRKCVKDRYDSDNHGSSSDSHGSSSSNHGSSSDNHGSSSDNHGSSSSNHGSSSDSHGSSSSNHGSSSDNHGSSSYSKK